MRYYRRVAQTLEPFTVEIEFLLNGSELRVHKGTVYAQDRRRAVQEAVRDLVMNFQHHRLSIKKATISRERDDKRNQNLAIH